MNALMNAFNETEPEPSSKNKRGANLFHATSSNNSTSLGIPPGPISASTWHQHGQDVAILYRELNAIKTRCSLLEILVAQLHPELKNAPDTWFKNFIVDSRKAMSRTSPGEGQVSTEHIRETPLGIDDWQMNMGTSQHTNDLAFMGFNPGLDDWLNLDSSGSRQNLEANSSMFRSHVVEETTHDQTMTDDFYLDAAAFTEGLDFQTETVQNSFENDVPKTSSQIPSDANTNPGSDVVQPMHRCPNCPRVYSRLADLRRHALSHNPDAPQYLCPSMNCTRTFLRKDKLKDHRARMNH